MTVRWTRRALGHLDAQAAYIARFDPEAAARVVARIEEVLSHVAVHPGIGRAGRLPGTRELVVAGTPYIVPYRVHGDTIEILAVLHASRKPPGA